MTSLRVALKAISQLLHAMIKIPRCERHTLYRSALFILAHIDKALAGLSWRAIARESRSRINCDSTVR